MYAHKSNNLKLSFLIVAGLLLKLNIPTGELKMALIRDGLIS